MEPGWNNQHSKPFPINTGVRQGCILSPHLFNIYTEQIMRDTITEDTGMSVGGRKIYNIRYADDTALCAMEHQEAQRLLEELNERGRQDSLNLMLRKQNVDLCTLETQHPTP